LVITWRPSSRTNPVPKKFRGGERVFWKVPTPTIDGFVYSIVLTSSLLETGYVHRRPTTAALIKLPRRRGKMLVIFTVLLLITLPP
jgi:hypothetical protein